MHQPVIYINQKDQEEKDVQEEDQEEDHTDHTDHTDQEDQDVQEEDQKEDVQNHSQDQLVIHNIHGEETTVIQLKFKITVTMLKELSLVVMFP